ncbi:hypothetical protein Ait01nite_089680 [Actinoplanes italicus]|uniref:Uncharacterized protein n=1 Tax=Actinoplanes italicus TaxID=113567 RepID=A0A2T0JIF5_9ACTN|nr:hypothetical protein [Actinoplanes italicus]PRX07385.1 hypothetical protein CLV67_14260 [Actinoplanes italicus]GIE35923.1 hypothetical protein Ait01nite_089680 [Actinoplanes italicus]
MNGEVHGTRELTAVESDFLDRHGDAFIDARDAEPATWPKGEALSGDVLDQDGERVDVVQRRDGFTVVDRRRLR